MNKISHFTLVLFVIFCFDNCTKETPAPAPEDIIFKTSFRRDTTIILKVNDTYKVNIIPGNAKVEMTITIDNSYKTSRNGVITIDEAGEIKALGAGKAFVIIKNNAERITFNVVVVELPSALSIPDSLIVIKTGKGYQLKNQYLNEYEIISFGCIKWEASDSSIVKVSNSGYVTALKEGNTKVMVSMQNYPDIKSEYSVQTVNHIVYLAGSRIGEGEFYPVCWRNNIRYKDFAGDLTTYGMLYLNDNLYLAGFELVIMPDDYNKAFLITNNTKYIFPESGAAAMGITHSGNDIYISGSYTNNGIRTVALWKNSLLNPILSASEATTESRGRCVATSLNDIYIGGFVKNSKGIQVACYWKNKQRIDLSDGTKNSEVSSIFIDGNDVYAAGYYEGVIDGSFKRIGCYWKNGIKYDLTSGSSEANSIFVSNGNFYIAGSYMNNNSIACYWKNGIKYDLPIGTIGVSGYALSIEVIEGIEYISGYYTTKDYYPNNFNKSIGCYWKKGIRYDIPTYSIVGCMAID